MEFKNIYEKLSFIQCNLKAPKGQYNNFGKYKYRSLEDIQEGLKPLLKVTGTAVILTDEIVEKGDRFYIRSTVKLIDTETKETIETVSYAREEKEKKGMDGSQVTGAASSYARKYAMNALFAIDDTKDSDATNEHKKVEKINYQQQLIVYCDKLSKKYGITIEETKKKLNEKFSIDLNEIIKNEKLTQEFLKKVGVLK